MNKVKKQKYKWIKRIAKILIILVTLFAFIILFIRSPWGQEIIVNKLISYLSNETKTTIKLSKAYVTFSGNILLEEFYIEDQKQDTLLYSKKLEASIALLPLIRGTSYHLKTLDWDGVKANITRKKDTKSYNFDFILESFTTQTDTTKTSSDVPIIIGGVSLTDFEVLFLDETAGIDSTIKLGELSFDMETFDLLTKNFGIRRFYFSDSDIRFKQTELTKTSTDTKSNNTELPKFKIDYFSIDQVNIFYQSVPDSITFSSNIGKLDIDNSYINLIDEEYSINEFKFDDSKILLKSLSNSKKNQPQKESPFHWPDLTLNINFISLENNSFLFQNKSTFRKEKQFDPSYISLQSILLKAENLNIAKGKAGVNLQKTAFTDHSGFKLRHLSSVITIDETSSTRLKKVYMQTNESNIKGNFNIQYNSLFTLVNSPEKAIFDITLDTLNLGIKDAYYFQSSLAQNNYIDSLAQKRLHGSLSLKGKISDFKTNIPNLYWGKDTRIQLEGNLKNLLTENQIQFDSISYNFISTKQNLKAFINESDYGINLPSEIGIEGNISGHVNDLDGNTLLKSSMGSVLLSGNYSNKDQISFNGDVSVDKFQLQKLLNNQQLGSITLNAQITGSGSSLNTLNATLDSEFKEITINEYNFSDFKLRGEIVNGKGNVNAKFKDRNLNFLLNTNLVLDSISPKVNGFLNIAGADLNGLGIITNDIIKTQCKISFDYTGNSQDFRLHSKITDALVVKNNEPYQIADIKFDALSNSNTSEVLIGSEFLDANILANTRVDQIVHSIQNRLKTYISENKIKDTIQKSAEITMDLVVREKPILSNILLPGIKELDSITANLYFSEDKEKLIVNLDAPSINYNNSSIDSLSLNIDADKKDVKFSLGWKSIVSDPIQINKTAFEGVLKDQTLLLDFSTDNETERIASVKSELRLKKDTLYYHIDPKSIVFDKNPWSISSNNQITIAKNYIDFKDFEIKQNQQQLIISSDDSQIDKKHIGISFYNFNASTFTSILSDDEILANGIIDGKIIFENPFEQIGLIADLNVQELKVKGITLGDLTLDAISKSFQNYDLSLLLNGENVKLNLNGDYQTKENESEINFDLNLEKLQVQVLEKFMDQQISETKGIISGNTKIKGTTLNPIYKGTFHFENTSMIVNSLNTRFTLPEENISITNTDITLNNFTIADENLNTFSLDGKISTKDLNNPDFNLSLNTKNFQILNATRENNDLFFGNVKITADLDIEGNLDIPKIKGDLAIDEDSNFTLIVPESELEIKEREGIVVFVNRKNPDAIITRVEEDRYANTLLKGYDINTKLKIDKGSVFKIVIDERSKDNFQISGEGELKFGMEPNGRTTLTGRYDITDGHYEVSLYNIVKRRFQIAPGGSITWLGDPLDAKLDVTAIYNVETSAASLMAAKTSGESSGITNQFRQKLPFLVYLNVDGQLLEPEISFQLDMPEDEQGSLGGEVYGQVQQLNSQEEELNKQVFSLLVLNRFFPDAGSDGSNGGAVSIARDNVNKVLSGQLNSFSDKLIGDTGVELDFGLNSYTDYQGNAAQNRTQLEINAQKRLFNDRLIVQVGSDVDIEGSSQNSAETTPVIGNVSLEYLLTKNGRYRLKGFRKNEFESVIDGQLIVTGIAFIFNREFNEFKELFSKSIKEELKKQKSKEN
ncbi:translocation/assembly module TamB domain-containing protein [uncultured Aquimarina sp.]|uniref:translocation/assembly module TamB domain-containing protein n=1 Tax=uncultured Aquimarina sp. TaxID=575652 RepID=UPI002602A994|nr:translocation/assembly module TamB domain-containing protein [uncultured Aquimarina sp.]